MPFVLDNSGDAPVDRETTFNRFISQYCNIGGPQYERCTKSLFDLIVPKIAGIDSILTGVPTSLLDSTRDGPNSFAANIYANYPYPTFEEFSEVVPIVTQNGENLRYSVNVETRPECETTIQRIQAIDDVPVIYNNALLPFEERGPGNDLQCTNDGLLLNQRYIQLYYNAAIAYADLLRAKRGRIFTIGYGAQDRCGPNTAEGLTGSSETCLTALRGEDYQEAYQRYNDSLSRKDIFLARLANDNSTRPAGVDFPLESGLMSWDEQDEEQRGQYVATNDPAELQSAFNDIASLIVELNR